MEEERFHISWEERQVDFEKMQLPLWEITILHAFTTVLEDKVNAFDNRLWIISEYFVEKYDRLATEVSEEEFEDRDRVNLQLAVIEAIRLFYGWGSVSLDDFEQLLKGLSVNAKGWLNKKIQAAIRWLTQKLLAFFKSFARHLRVQSWSVGGSFGFPSLAISISVSFEPV